MANTISIINYNNTFSDWVVATNALIKENNDFAANNYYKPAGTLFLNDPSLGLQVATAAIIGGQLQVQGVNSSAYVQNNLRVDGQVYFTNTILGLTNAGQANIGGTILALASNNGIIVSNSAIVGANLNVVNTITTTNLYASQTITANVILANTAQLANSVSAPTGNFGDLSVSGQLLVTGGFVFPGSAVYEGNQIVLSGSYSSGINSYIVVNRGTSGANAVFRWNEANTYFDTLNVTDSKYYRLLTGDLLSTSTSSNSNTTIATSWVANTLNTKIATANAWSQSNVGSALASAKAYTDTANTFLNNKIVTLQSNVNSSNAYIDSTNTFLRANDTITLNAAKAYADAINVYSSNAESLTSGTINVLRLPTSGVTPNRYGNTTAIPSITVDAYGRVTAISNNMVNIPSSTITLSGDSGSGSVSTGGTLLIQSSNTQIANVTVTGATFTYNPQFSGVNPGTYTISTITVDAYGRITGATSGTVAGVNITNDTTSGTVLYPLMATVTTGSLPGANTSSSKLSYVPSTGTLSTTALSTANISATGQTSSTKGYREGAQVISASASQNLDLSQGNIFNITLNGTGIVFTFTNPPANGTACYITVLLTQGTGGSKTCSFTNARYTDAVAPVLTTTAGKTDLLSFITVDGGSNYYGSFAGANFG